MYKRTCKKCGSTEFYTETKANNTGLYCSNCGAWQTWLGKDLLRAFLHSMREATSEEKESVDKYIDSISKPTGSHFYDEKTIVERLQSFVKGIDQTIDNEYEKLPISTEDAVRKSSYCLALERCKTAISNILNGREFDDIGED